MTLASERSLLSASLALGASRVKGWSAAELRLVVEATASPRSVWHELRDQIRNGADPLGEAFCDLRSAAVRRRRGATYTPFSLVRSMVAWARRGDPGRVVDPGVGSGRFLLEASQAFPRARLLGFEIDPLAAIIARANLAALGVDKRTRIVLCDYREARLDEFTGQTLFIGNPPYVRHHDLDPRWKRWLTREAGKLGLPASQLAGLHIHFFLATAALARPGDLGTFVTSAEWLDVNYGALARGLFLNGLGMTSLSMLDPAVQVFSDAATTSVITTFLVGGRHQSIRVKHARALRDLDRLDTGRTVRRERLQQERRWSNILKPPRKVPAGFVELGELCRVSRGQVTGCNKVWICGEMSRGLPAEVLFPTVTRARELFEAAPALRSLVRLRSVIDLPADLSVFDDESRCTIDRFLEYAKALEADATYVARHRKPWWSVGLAAPAPILATYMARRPPAFVLNPRGARHVNIAHGIYPRQELSKTALRRLAEHLSRGVDMSSGRTYAGGLTKFEPREMERILVPPPEVLSSARE